MEVFIEAQIYDEMRKEVRAAFPREACGLIADHQQMQTIYPIQNISNVDTTFTMDPQQLIDALMDIRKKSASIRYLYHSHPMGTGTPSQTDLENDVFPDIAHLIWSKESGDWQCRVFRYTADRYTELNLQVLS